MASETDQLDTYEMIKQYLRYWQLNTSLECLEDELKKKVYILLNQQSQPKKITMSSPTTTKLSTLLRMPANKTKTQTELQVSNKVQLRKYQQVLQTGRQIFSVSINLLQVIQNIKESGQRYESTNQAIQNYKIQLGKHHKIIINEGSVQGSELISENIIREHRAKLQQYFANKNVDGMVQTLLSLRVSALQIAPQLRKNLVQQLIRRDILNIVQHGSFEFLLQVLAIKNKPLRHATISLISVIVSTLRGIQYITYGQRSDVIERIIKILKEQQNGNVTQRFCLAVLQKCSVKQTSIKCYLDSQMIIWVLQLVKKSSTINIHMFCLDFATAMLANIVHSKTCQNYLERKPQMINQLVDNILKYIREPLEVSVLMHLLITLSYLCRDRFMRQIEELALAKRIKEFAEYYQGSNRNSDPASQMDRRTVLDLCNHMFHSKQQQYDTQERIRQYQNQQGELIFECFQDEIN